MDTISDVIREKREMAAKIRAELSQVPTRREDELLAAESLEREADRIEAAAKRERGNAAAMREALVAVKKSIDGIGESSLDCDPTVIMAALTQICARLSARIGCALAEPPRNCDVGTPEEQTKRFYDYCDKSPCIDCPLLSAASKNCHFTWAQMPYDEKGESDGR